MIISSSSDAYYFLAYNSAILIASRYTPLLSSHALRILIHDVVYARDIVAIHHKEATFNNDVSSNKD